MTGAPRAVLFDLDDTLFAHAEAVAAGITAHRLATLVAGTPAMGTRPDDTDDAAHVSRWHELEELHYHRYLAGELSFLDQRRARARGFVERQGIDLSTDEAADAWFARYLVEYERGWMLHDDALPCLDELRLRIPGVRFGIITNAELSFQQAKIAAIGLGVHLHDVVASGEVGFPKPDARIFTAACERLGVDPADGVYVGDRLETDAIGAARAGMRGIWLDRGGVATAAQRAAAAEAGARVIRSLTELPDLVAPR